DDHAAPAVADNLGITPLPPRTTPYIQPRPDLRVHNAPSILKSPPNAFAGPKMGVLISDCVDLDLLNPLKESVELEHGVLAVIGPKIAGIEASDGTQIMADEAIAGGSSVLFDAVALLPGTKTAAVFARHPRVRDFVADAFTHFKFIGLGPDA